jgi:predicted HicB family RNase H-like nuclease
MQEKELKRLSLEVDKEFHSRIKIEAALRNISIKDYIIQTIVERISRDDKYRK